MSDDHASSIIGNLKEVKKQKERERYAKYRADNKEKIKQSNKDYRNKNKERVKKATANWAAKNPEKVKQYSKKWQQENPEKRRQAGVKWKAEHYEQAKESSRLRAAKRREEKKEHCLQIKRDWAKNNPAKILAYTRNVKAKRKRAVGKHYGTDIQELLRLQKHTCVICHGCIKTKYHVDHIIPLARGGTNDKYNLQLLCPECNMKKGIQHPIDFMQLRGLLL